MGDDTAGAGALFKGISESVIQTLLRLSRIPQKAP